jgi:hypothetical protein
MLLAPRVVSAPAPRVLLGEGPVWDERIQKEGLIAGLTTASIGLENSAMPESLAGALFGVDLGVGGIPANRFGG